MPKSANGAEAGGEEGHSVRKSAMGATAGQGIDAREGRAHK